MPADKLPALISSQISIRNDELIDDDGMTKNNNPGEPIMPLSVFKLSPPRLLDPLPHLTNITAMLLKRHDKCSVAQSPLKTMFINAKESVSMHR